MDRRPPFDRRRHLHRRAIMGIAQDAPIRPRGQRKDRMLHRPKIILGAGIKDVTDKHAPRGCGAPCHAGRHMCHHRVISLFSCTGPSGPRSAHVRLLKTSANPAPVFRGFSDAHPKVIHKLRLPLPAALSEDQSHSLVGSESQDRGFRVTAWFKKLLFTFEYQAFAENRSAP